MKALYAALFPAVCLLLTGAAAHCAGRNIRVADTGIRTRIYRYTVPPFEFTYIKGAVKVVDSPGHKIKDAVAAGFSVLEIASIVAMKYDGIPVTEPYESRIARETLELGGNAFQIQETVIDEHTSGMIVAVFAQAYRIEWNGRLQEFFEETDPAASAYNLGADGKASRAYTIGDFTQLGRFLKDREKAGKLKEKREAALMKLESLPYCRIRKKILNKPGADPIGNPELRKLSRSRPKGYKQFKRLYFRAHGKLPPEDPAARSR